MSRWWAAKLSYLTFNDFSTKTIKVVHDLPDNLHSVRIAMSLCFARVSPLDYEKCFRAVFNCVAKVSMSKTNPYLLACVFPGLTPVIWISFSSDWFNVMFAFVAIGPSNYFGFATINQMKTETLLKLAIEKKQPNFLKRETPWERGWKRSNFLSSRSNHVIWADSLLVVGSQ